MNFARLADFSPSRHRADHTGASPALPMLFLTLFSMACPSQVTEPTPAPLPTDPDPLEPEPPPILPEETGPLRIAVLLPPLPNGDTRRMEMEMAVAWVQEAGGLGPGRALQLEAFPYNNDDELAQAAQDILADPGIMATIGPGRSSDVMAVAPAFTAARQVLISPTSTSDEVLRAFPSEGFVWRTKESDIGQTELFVSYASQLGASRIALLASDDLEGQTFFNWFGFFATEQGFAASDIHVDLVPSEACEATVEATLEHAPDVLFASVGSHEQLGCIADAWVRRRRAGATSSRLVFADVGMDYTRYGADANEPLEGVEGFASTAPAGSTFEAELKAWSGRDRVPPNAAAAFDAVLLLAYGLQESGRQGGEALARALIRVVDGDGEAVGYDVEGIGRALTAIAAGEQPDIAGATGGLAYEPSLYVDLAESTFGRWVWERGTPRFVETWFTGDPALLTSSKALVGPSDVSEFVPATSPGYEVSRPAVRARFLLGSLSSGWGNYRHQADVLRQYQHLRALGVAEADILLIGADDIAHHASNALPGVVRNEAGGENLYTGVEYDYHPGELSSGDLLNIISGQPSAHTPLVFSPDEEANLYIYLAGHGGTGGLPIGASTVAEGLQGGAEDLLLSPTALRETLCALKVANGYQRAVIVLEACYAGVFGSALHDGLEMGCGGDGITPGAPLPGTLLITAANTAEVSFAAEYDEEQRAWVADEFSHRFAARAFPTSGVHDDALLDLFMDTGGAVTGAHPSIYNEGAFGNISQIRLTELLAP